MDPGTRTLGEAMLAGERWSGVLLHPTSLPGPHGIGELGPAADRFVDFLAQAGQRIWQVLPLAPTGYGDSPYQALSAFAGNPLLVSLERLAEEGWLHPGELAGAPRFPEGEVEFERLIPWKTRLLRVAADRFEADAGDEDRRAFEAFVAGRAAWLEDFALFAALKELHGGIAWIRWPAAQAGRDAAALAAARAACAREIRAQQFFQFAFFRQWARLRRRCRERGLVLMGDVPIYLAHDSAEVWGWRGLFQLDARGEPERVAGVPPDFFSAGGQLWGNPLYRWDQVERQGFAFWVARMRATLELVDWVRLDHFRGFEAYWEIPAGAADARGGRWVPGPGARLFEALERALGKLPLVAENLGVITPPVEELRRRFGFPGMAVLQFAFGTDPQAPGFRPHAYVRDLVAYTGTHDNDTAMGWWRSDGSGDTRTPEEVAAERDRALRYLAADGREMSWTLVRAALASVAGVALFPAQDLLGLGSEARMNRPSTPTGNWRWRLRGGELTPALASRLRDATELYGRAPPADQAGRRSSNQ